MRALVGLLRREGVLLRQPRRWRDGELRTERSDGGGSLRLVLRDLNRPAGNNVVAELYRPQIISLNARCLRVQGIEPVGTHNQQTAAVVQEWAVVLFGSIPSDTGGRYFSPALLVQVEPASIADAAAHLEAMEAGLEDMANDQGRRT